MQFFVEIQQVLIVRNLHNEIMEFITSNNSGYWINCYIHRFKMSFNIKNFIKEAFLIFLTS